MIAADLRKRRPKPHTTWHLDDVYLKIDGRMGPSIETRPQTACLCLPSRNVKFSSADEKPYQAVDIARLLGWIDSSDKMNPTARACSAAYALIKGGYLSRKDLHDLTVKGANMRS